MNYNYVSWITVVLTLNFSLDNWSGPFNRCEGISAWKGYGGRGRYIGQPLPSRREKAKECSWMDQLLRKGMCPGRLSIKSARSKPSRLLSRFGKEDIDAVQGNLSSILSPLSSTERTPTLEVLDAARCKYHHKDICRCQRDIYCAFNRETKRCVPLYNYCLNMTFKAEECREPLKFYAYGGILCRNKLRGGFCKDTKTFLAVNVNGANTTGSDNIAYERGSKLIIFDEYDTRNYESLTKAHENLLGLSHKGDRCLFASYIYSIHRDNCRCLSTPIQKLVDGKYELILKFVDPTPTGRTFDVKMNGVTVLNEFRILRYTSVNYKPLEVSIKFEVKKNRTILYLKGHPPSKIKNCRFMLSFCRGECSHHRAYIISAIAVIQYPNVTDSMLSSLIPTTPNEASQILQQVSQALTNPSLQLSENDTCNLSQEVTICKSFPYCRYSSRFNKCQHQDVFCSHEKFRQSHYCIIPGKWVAADGDVCLITRRLLFSTSAERCVVIQDVAAINFGSFNPIPITGSDGMSYTSLAKMMGPPPPPNPLILIPLPFGDVKEALSTAADTLGISEIPTLSEAAEISGVSRDDQIIYNSFLVGVQPDKIGRCTDPIPQLQSKKLEDGVYLMRLRFAEPLPIMLMGVRRFTIKINDKKVLNEFDILSIAKVREGKDVLINLEVTENSKRLKLRGFATVKFSGTLEVKICYGMKGIPVIGGPIISGLSLVQLTLPCAAYNATQGNDTDAECRCLNANTKPSGRKCAFDHDTGACVELDEFCVTAFNELNETRFLDGHFCPLLHAHYTFNGRICSTKYLHWKKPLKRCYCRTSDGIGMNFNATKYHGSDYNYKGGSISNITDGNYSDDPHLDNFLTGGMTPDNLTEEWGTKGVRHAMKHWFVSKGKKGKCLSINLTMICPQLTKPRVLDYFLVTFIPEHNYEKREERIFDIKINDVILASHVRPTELAQEIRETTRPKYSPEPIHEADGNKEQNMKVGGLQIVTYIRNKVSHLEVFHGTLTDTTKILPTNDNTTYNLQICNANHTCSKERSNFIIAGFYLFPATGRRVMSSESSDSTSEEFYFRYR